MSQRVGEQVPAPVPPDNPDAWYAPEVCDQREIHPGVVATIRERPDGFAYEVREPSMTPGERRDFGRVREHFGDAGFIDEPAR